MREEIEGGGGFRGFLRGRGLFIAIWVACFVIVSVIFLVKLDDIKTNLKNTRFFERIFGSTPEFIERHVDKNEQFKSDLGAGETVITVGRLPGAARAADGSEMFLSDSVWSRPNVPEETAAAFPSEPEAAAEAALPAETAAESGGGETFSGAEGNSASLSYEVEEDAPQSPAEERFVPRSLPVKAADTELAREEPFAAEQSVETATARLWFVAVDADGHIARRLCPRTIVRSTAPLTNNMKLLLQGPNSIELDSGCMTLVPEGTRLLNALVKDGVAYLNFSEEFASNRVGAEGYLAQLQQVVFTSTEFATVKSVQILIDGQKKDSLGDGIWVGSPLSRADFQ